MAELLVAADEVVCRFGPDTAVDHVSIEVGPGEVVGLLGANGAGKTTLIRMLLGLLVPTEGGVRLFGRPPDREGRRRLGYVPQTLGLWSDLTVAENLAFTEAVFGVTARPSLLGALGVPGDRIVSELPLGPRRRVAFAAAFSHDPELVVLDEPTSGVDPLARARMWDSIRDAADGGVGVLVTTHYLEEASNCDRLVAMARGRVVAAGTLEEVVGHETAVVVASEVPTDAFTVLDAAGLSAGFAGREVRVTGADTEVVEALLRRANIAAVLDTVPATLDETFVRLTKAAG